MAPKIPKESAMATEIGMAVKKASAKINRVMTNANDLTYFGCFSAVTSSNVDATAIAGK